MHTLFLALHLLGAVALAALVMASIFTVVRGRAHEAAGYARSLALLALVQTGTGACLAFISPGGSALAFCSKIGVYIAVIVITELFLFRTARGSEAFPLRPVLGAVFISIISTTLVALSRY